MKKKHKKNVLRYRRQFHINIGVIVFAFVLIYFLVYFFNFMTARHVSVYEVQKGQIMKTSYYTGLILRSETVTYAEQTGKINYYSREGDKAGYNDLVCSIDPEGSVSDEITAAGLDGAALTKDELLEIQDLVTDFTSNYSDTQFYNVYAFTENLNDDVQGNLYLAALEQLADQMSDSFSLIRAQTDGILAFYTDGYENVTPDTFTPDMYQASEYRKNNLKSNTSVSSGQALYKTVTDENWYMMIPLDEDDARMYQDEMDEGEDSFTILVTFRKDDAQTYATASLRSYDSGYFLELEFNSSQIRYVSERYMEVELGSDDESGLKIPNSAITQKEFLLIPEEYISQGGSTTDRGVLKITTDKHGNESVEFVSTTVYYTDESTGYCYIDEDDLVLGDTLQRTDSSGQYVITETGELSGVYNMNKGYAVFRRIDVITSNEEYSIISTGTSYGLSLYDRIALDGGSISEGEFAN
ncbi:MAG: hypothetical protein LIP11_05805 [Clostridiales bacterium]|nr:hypothetical protein [Clostridiales bacterium]